MASLTPLSKGLIGLAVVGGMASAVWHLGLKEQLGGDAAVRLPAAESAPPVRAAPAAPPAAPPAATPALTPGAAPAVTPATAPAMAQASKMSPAANAEAGRKLVESGDFTQARAHLELAVQEGDAGSACLLGEMTLKGQGGMPANQEKAAALFQLAQSRNIICFTAGK